MLCRLPEGAKSLKRENLNPYFNFRVIGEGKQFGADYPHEEVDSGRYLLLRIKQDMSAIQSHPLSRHYQTPEEYNRMDAWLKLFGETALHIDNTWPQGSRLGHNSQGQMSVDFNILERRIDRDTAIIGRFLSYDANKGKLYTSMTSLIPENHRNEEGFDYFEGRNHAFISAGCLSDAIKLPATLSLQQIAIISDNAARLFAEISRSLYVPEDLDLIHDLGIPQS